MRKKGKNKGKTEATDDAIVLQETEETFSSSQLKEAIRAANAFAQSKKSSGAATVILKSGVFALKGSFSFTENITLKGEDGTNVVLDANCGFEVKARSLNIQNITFSVSKRAKNANSLFKVAKSGKLIMSKSAIEPEQIGVSHILAISNNGNVEVTYTMFRNACIHSDTALSLSNCNFIGEEVDPSLCCVTSKGSVSIKDCSFKNVSEGIRVSNGTATFVNNSFFTAKSCVIVENTKAILERCEFTSAEADAIRVAGKRKTKILNASFTECSAGLSCHDEADVTLTTGVMKGLKGLGVFVRTGAKVRVTDLAVIGMPDTKSYGFRVKEGSVNVTDVKLENLHSAVYSEQGSFEYEGLNIVNCLNGISWLESQVKGLGLNIETIAKDAIRIVGKTSAVQVKDTTLREARVGVTVTKAKNVVLTNTRMVSMKTHGFLIQDSSCTVRQAHINNAKTKAIGIKVLYSKQMHERTILDECKTQSCSVGIEVIEEHEVETKSEDEQGLPRETLHDSSNTRASNIKDLSAKTDLENCSFIKCRIAFSVDGARATVKGCSFIMSSKHSVFIKNEALMKGNELRKKSKLKIRWANFVEPHIDNSNAVSNNTQLMGSMTEEKSFFGSAEFEPVMYLPTLTERIRQAKNLKNSQEKNPSGKARVIMRSVHHMLILLKKLPSKLLTGDLLEDPELGMFAATFKLYGAERKKKTSTLINMDDLFVSWKSLGRTRLFDRALGALNRAFNEKQVSEDLYDDWVTPLEELQRVCFIGSKYNRRRDYLLITAKENPLSAWYFLDKENPNTDEGKRLRSEVLKYLARDEDVILPHQQQNFHASWVSQWAVNLLGEEFTNSRIPGDKALRRAWGDKLLDDLNPTRILAEYKRVGNVNEFTKPVDELLKYEAICLFEAVVKKLDNEKMIMLGGLFNNRGQTGAVHFAASIFKGQGALPGYLRRITKKATSPESLLLAISDLYEDNPGMSVQHKLEVVLAVMGHYFYEDPQTEPRIQKRVKGSYETCPSCLVQKLQPWNELKLGACKHNHRLCKGCFKNSMSTASKGLWGACAGVDKDNKPCTALATRREMEMAGMEKPKIYNILRTRIVSELQKIKGWKQCDSPGCIGGSSSVKKDYFHCRLCKKVITKDGGKSDPTVNIKLLKGLDGTPIARGEGLFRECYHCAVIYEKGNACSTITCQNCQKQFSMTWGPEHISHRFDEEGVGPQMYVPKKEGKLWNLGVFKTRKNKPLALGQVLNEKQAMEVVRRAKVLLDKLDG